MVKRQVSDMQSVCLLCTGTTFESRWPSQCVMQADKTAKESRDAKGRVIVHNDKHSSRNGELAPGHHNENPLMTSEGSPPA